MVGCEAWKNLDKLLEVHVLLLEAVKVHELVVLFHLGPHEAPFAHCAVVALVDVLVRHRSACACGAWTRKR